MTKQVVAFQQPEIFIRKRQILPRKDQLPLRCGKCGRADFAVFMKVNTADVDSARVNDLICLYCSSVYNLDDQARIEGKQEID